VCGPSTALSRPALAAACGLLAIASAGCGNQRAKPIDLSHALTPKGRQVLSFPAAGLQVRAPANWHTADEQPPFVKLVFSGRATIAIWRYRRSEQLPKDAGSLDRARQALIDAAKARDKSLRLRRSQVTRIGGVPAVVLIAVERIGPGVRAVRSTHLYAHGGEIVVDAYAPPSEFATLDRTAFRPLLSSLRITRPR
jgi:hypothetical protein